LSGVLHEGISDDTDPIAAYDRSLSLSCNQETTANSQYRPIPAGLSKKNIPSLHDIQSTAVFLSEPQFVPFESSCIIVVIVYLPSLNVFFLTTARTKDRETATNIPVISVKHNGVFRRSLLENRNRLRCRFRLDQSVRLTAIRAKGTSDTTHHN
jgi:hypothetical protein